MNDLSAFNESNQPPAQSTLSATLKKLNKTLLQLMENEDALQTSKLRELRDYQRITNNMDVPTATQTNVYVKLILEEIETYRPFKIMQDASFKKTTLIDDDCYMNLPARN
ncbi:hypothetical protein [Chitinophaga defluvii]|uniref:Uncharacterized protein n=1 Tax=Chitinophaga defluvii TaxID=3163343 RepID=A0ABV2TET5_9BACT